MKFLRNSSRAINIAHVIDITVSANYLVLSTIDGREEKFIYGPEDKLMCLMSAVLAFIAEPETHVLDCDEYMLSL